MNNAKKILTAVLAVSLSIPTSAMPVLGAPAKDADLEVKLLSGEEAAGYQTKANEALAISNAAKLPAEFDLRDLDVVTPVKFQNPFGTCWAFGASAAAESNILTDLGLTNTEAKVLFGEGGLDLSEKHLAYWAYHTVPESDDVHSQGGEGNTLFKEESASDVYDNGGTDVLAHAIYSSGVGPTLEASYPYTFLDKDGNNIKNPDLTDTIVDWSLPAESQFDYLFQLRDGNLLPSPAVKKVTDPLTGAKEWVEYDESATATIKQELIRGRGVVLNYKADQSMPGDVEPDSHMNTETWAQYDDESVDFSHAVCIVGWDDTFSKDKFLTPPPGDGAWIVKNSWSTAYGDNGYFYLSYYDHSIYSLESFDFDLSDRSFDGNGLYIDQWDYMPSMAGKVNLLELESSAKPIKMANVYTATMDVDLNSVGFTTVYPNSRVTIKLCSLGEDGSLDNSESIETLDSKVVTIEYAGFHRIDLNGEYHIKKGDKYAVIVTEQRIDENGINYIVHASIGLSKTAIEEVNPMLETIGLPPMNAYAVAVVNPDESYLNTGSKWEDWSAKRNEYEAVAASEGSFEVDNFSIKAYGIPSALDVPDAPDTPTKVKAKAKKNTITVSWKPVEGADGYCIHYGTDPENLEGELDATKTKVKIKGLKKKTTYYISVHSVVYDDLTGDVLIESEPSSIIKVKTK